MKIHPEEQGSLAWMVARAGVVTASEFDNLVTPEFKPRTGQTVQSYLARKVAEKWLGGPLPKFSSFDMEQGQILENEAIPFYELERGVEVQRVGLITTDCGRIGCSPDGLIGDDSGIEIKCPSAERQAQYLLDGCVPKEYLAQVHGAMFVTGRPTWTFLSYRRGFPPLIVTVEASESIQEVLSETLWAFVSKLDRAYERMEEINGGPPARKPVLQSVESEPIDIIP